MLVFRHAEFTLRRRAKPGYFWAEWSRFGRHSLRTLLHVHGGADHDAQCRGSLDHNLLNLWIGRSALMYRVETVQSARGPIPADNLYMGTNQAYGTADYASQ